METQIAGIPVLKPVKTGSSCCSKPAQATVCCTPASAAEETDGACCAQPADGTPCCDK